MGLWGPYKWPYKWVTGVAGVITQFIIGRGPPWMHCHAFSRGAWTWMFLSFKSIWGHLQNTRWIETCGVWCSVAMFQTFIKLSVINIRIGKPWHWIFNSFNKIQRIFTESPEILWLFRPYDFDFTTHVKLGSPGAGGWLGLMMNRSR